MTPETWPSISVIITNYNYRHYLPSCLASVLGQTVAPDEILVVDDGSTDSSLSYLQSRSDITLITKPNGGQASGFNAGFAAATGDLVLFLDADDALQPHALETLCRAWSTKRAALSFGLEVIDAKGESRGRYPLRVPKLTDRVTLLRDRSFPFMPTSGNAFRRKAIEWAFPLPEENWRISADALLLRVASLSGGIRHLPQMLGSYRAHGHNNYFRHDISLLWRTRRGLGDIAQSALDLAGLSKKAPVKSAAGLASILLLGAIRSAVTRYQMGGERSALVKTLKDVRRMWRSTVGHRGTFVLFLLRFILPVSTRMQLWITEPLYRPWILQRLRQKVTGPRLASERAKVLTPDSVAARKPGRKEAVDLPLKAHAFGLEWYYRYKSPSVDLWQDEGEILLARTSAEPAMLLLDVSCPECFDEIRIKAFHNGKLVTDILFSEESVVEVLLSAPASVSPSPDVVTLQVKALNYGFWSRLALPFLPSHRLALHGIKLIASHTQKTGAVPPVSADAAFQKILPTLRAGAMYDADEDEGPFLGSEDTLVVGTPEGGVPAVLSLLLSEDQALGWFVVRREGEIIFQGWIGPGTQCVFPLRPELESDAGTITLETAFRPDDALHESLVDIKTIGIVPTKVYQDAYAPLLAANFWLTNEIEGGIDRYLGEGWESIEEDAVIMTSTSSVMRFAHPPLPLHSALRFQIDLDPIAPLPPPSALNLVVEVNGEEAATLTINDRELIDVPIDDHLDPSTNVIEVALHAMVRTGLSETKVLAHPGLRLEGFGITDTARPASEIVAADAQAALEVDVPARIDRIEAALAARRSLSELGAMGDDLLGALDGITPNVAKDFLTPEAFTTLMELGRVLPRNPSAEVRLGRLPVENEGQWLIGLTRVILSGPAFETVPSQQFSALPELDASYTAILADYLMADAVPDTPLADIERHTAYVSGWLREIRNTLASGPPDNGHARLAAAMLDRCEHRMALFEEINLRENTANLGAALETDMILAGQVLRLPGIEKETHEGRYRVGILIHHLDPAPETWIVKGLVARIPKDLFDIRIFTLAQTQSYADDGIGVQVFGLGGQSHEICSTEIRRHCLDVLLLGCHISGASRQVRLAAHRLATHQIALSAISPMTTGLSSFDAFVMGDLVRPPDAEEQYTETLVSAPGTAQVFAFDAAEISEPPDPAHFRARLGLPLDAQIMTSGAMLDKIRPTLLKTWLEVLRDAPDAVLVLYPFAQNWNREFDEAGFIKNIETACEDFGVEPARIRLLAPMKNADVRRLLRLAALYLDSFPYSGATTVVEALTAGCPVVTCRFPTQRGIQGAGWLEAFGLGAWVSETVEDYAQTAVTLLQDPEQRRNYVEIADSNRDKALAQEEFSAWFADYLKTLVEGIPEPDEPPRYLFHHMAKTGGTAIRKMFSTWFDITNNYREPWSTTPPERLEIDDIGPNGMLSGHFNRDGAALNALYPETLDTSRWRRITFVRDPLETALSYYFFERDFRPKYDTDFQALSLSDYLRTYPSMYLEHFECTEANWREAIDGYWFIGTLERLEDCMDYLADVLEQPPLPRPFPRLNETLRDLVPSAEDIEIFTETAAIEFEMYREICARLAERLGEQPLDQFPR